MTSISAAPPHAPEWAALPERYGVAWGGPVAVLGDRASEVALAYHRAGAPPVVHDEPGIAYLSTGSERPSADAGAAGTGLADASVELVSLRRAWSDGASLAAACREAARILVPGGRLLMADYHGEMLLDQPPSRYPLQLVYRAVPGAAERLLQTDQHVRLPLQAMAAGFRDIMTDQVDETLGEFATVDDYADYLRAHGSERLVGMTRAQASAGLDALSELLPPLVRGPIVHREPWAIVAAVFPA